MDLETEAQRKRVTNVAPQDCPLTVTNFDDVQAAVSSSCRSIILDSITIPAKQFLDLKKLKDNTVVTFNGTTTLEYYALKSKNEQSQSPIQIGGRYITINSAPDALIEGNGAEWWDGFGSNDPNCAKDKVPAICQEGKPARIYKPNFLIKISKLDHSTITGLTIKNYPVHGITVSNTRNLTISEILLDNSAGSAPNERSTPLAAAHNTDGFGLANSTMVTLTNSTVINQDDCVAITSGRKYMVSRMVCVGGHGLAIGSVGGKGDDDPYKNQVEDVVFKDCELRDQTNGIRIKTNAGKTGLVRKYVSFFYSPYLSLAISLLILAPPPPFQNQHPAQRTNEVLR
ncbi:hypothetical protein BLS_003607 [Venturia inaequalis]|uniref:endo-polygalacturonase n=1 Tax=Venturia inaequalis TaxID=5025 RepID=A0A8H3UQH2_VENIN|nr:hypothetical protein BLS_003607 [Venturia inaequalis]